MKAIKKTVLEILTKHLKKCYVIHENDVKEVQLCKVLNTYTDKNEAKKDLIKLLVHKTTEQDILQVFTNKREL